ncbi:hypothetical protein PIB30_103616, partial [Stylosanthes scabra]|nr:hypothetical protein [Stylosanthes scabra]
EEEENREQRKQLQRTQAPLRQHQGYVWTMSLTWPKCDSLKGPKEVPSSHDQASSHVWPRFLGELNVTLSRPKKAHQSFPSSIQGHIWLGSLPRPNVTTMDSRQAWESLPNSRTTHVWSMFLDMAKRDSPRSTSPNTTQGHPKHDPNVRPLSSPSSKLGPNVVHSSKAQTSTEFCMSFSEYNSRGKKKLTWNCKATDVHTQKLGFGGCVCENSGFGRVRVWWKVRENEKNEGGCVESRSFNAEEGTARLHGPDARLHGPDARLHDPDARSHALFGGPFYLVLGPVRSRGSKRASVRL